MKIVTAPVIRKFFSEKSGQTVIECSLNGGIVAVWVPGDQTTDSSLICKLVVNEVGDTFVAARDSSRLTVPPPFPNPANLTGDELAKASAKWLTEHPAVPIYLKGQIVTRQAQSTQFKSFGGDNQAAQLMEAATAFDYKGIIMLQR